MSMHFVVIDGRRHPIRLEPTGQGGGEGDICCVADFRGCVAKVYHGRGGAQAAQRAKLEAMIRQPPALLRVRLPDAGRCAGVEAPRVAWPSHLVEDAAGRCVGFLMPEVPLARTVPLTRYMARSTLRSLPEVERGLVRRLQICRDLAAVVAELHRSRHHVVDLKAQNVLVYGGHGRVCLVDADSFSIAPERGGEPRFAATAFTPEYAAPELLRNALPPAGVVNDTQDRFALAALIHQVMNYGFHPFQGRPLFAIDEWNIASSIRQGFYPNGLRPHPQVSPAHGSCHDCWDTNTRRLFDRAFIGPPSARPAAAGWVDHFDALLSPHRQALVACAAVPASPEHCHFADMPCAACRHEGRSATPPAPARRRWHWLGGMLTTAIIATVGATTGMPDPEAAPVSTSLVPPVRSGKPGAEGRSPMASVAQRSGYAQPHTAPPRHARAASAPASMPAPRHAAAGGRSTT